MLNNFNQYMDNQVVVNESLHSVAAKKFNKATSPSCFEVLEAQVANQIQRAIVIWVNKKHIYILVISKII